MLYTRDELMEVDNDNYNSGIEGEDIYKSKEEKPVMASLSESYFKLDVILVNTNKYSFCSTLHYLLTI